MIRKTKLGFPVPPNFPKAVKQFVSQYEDTHLKNYTSHEPSSSMGTSYDRTSTNISVMKPTFDSTPYSMRSENQSMADTTPASSTMGQSPFGSNNQPTQKIQHVGAPLNKATPLAGQHQQQNQQQQQLGNIVRDSAQVEIAQAPEGEVQEVAFPSSGISTLNELVASMNSLLDSHDSVAALYEAGVEDTHEQLDSIQELKEMRLKEASDILNRINETVREHSRLSGEVRQQIDDLKMTEFISGSKGTISDLKKISILRKRGKQASKKSTK